MPRQPTRSGQREARSQSHPHRPGNRRSRLSPPGRHREGNRDPERTRDDAPAVGGFRISLAAAYARAGRLQEAKAAVAEGLRLTSRSESLLGDSWLHGGSVLRHFRNAEDLALIVDAMRQAGLPEWPFNFTGDERDQFKGAEIASLILGHTLEGQLEPEPPTCHHAGRTGRQSGFPLEDANAHAETVHVDRDLLCEQSENMFGRPDCGPVYRRNDVPTKIFLRQFKQGVSLRTVKSRDFQGLLIEF